MVDPKVYKFHSEKNWVELFRFLESIPMAAALEALDALVARGFYPNPDLYRAELAGFGGNVKRMEVALYAAGAKASRKSQGASATTWDKFQEVHRDRLNAVPLPQQLDMRDYFVSDGGTPKQQDIYIRLFGYDTPTQQGMNMSVSAGAVAFAAAINTPAYLAGHQPFLTIWFVGSAVATSDPSKEIVGQVTPRAKAGGKIFIAGGSAGGNTALRVASDLTTAGVALELVAICDGAFQRVDPSPTNFVTLSNDNPLTFKPKGKIDAGKKHNYYQSWGHTLDPNQELHGQLDGFTPFDLTNSPGLQKVRKTFEDNWVKTGKDKQKALEDAHKSAYADAFLDVARIINSTLKP